MADHNSVQAARRGSVTVAQTLNEPYEFAGRLRIAYAKLTASAQTLAQNDRVKLFELPAKAVPLFLTTKYGAFGASVTLDVGTGALDAANENLYESALDVSAAGKTFGWCDDNTQLTAATWVYAQFEGANPADDKDLEVWMAYVLD